MNKTKFRACSPMRHFSDADFLALLVERHRTKGVGSLEAHALKADLLYNVMVGRGLTPSVIIATLGLEVEYADWKAANPQTYGPRVRRIPRAINRTRIPSRQRQSSRSAAVATAPMGDPDGLGSAEQFTSQNPARVNSSSG